MIIVNLWCFNTIQFILRFFCIINVKRSELNTSQGALCQEWNHLTMAKCFIKCTESYSLQLTRERARALVRQALRNIQYAHYTYSLLLSFFIHSSIFRAPHDETRSNVCTGSETKDTIITGILSVLMQHLIKKSIHYCCDCCFL